MWLKRESSWYGHCMAVWLELKEQSICIDLQSLGWVDKHSGCKMYRMIFNLPSYMPQAAIVVMSTERGCHGNQVWPSYSQVLLYKGG